MKNIANLNAGAHVLLNHIVGPRHIRHDAVFLGFDGGGFTLRVEGSIHIANRYRWQDQNVWISEPGTDRAYVPFNDDFPLESDMPDRE